MEFTSVEKDEIRSLLKDYISTFKPKRVFTLLGLEGPLYNSDTHIVSAETNTEIFTRQLKKFPNATLYNEEAFCVLNQEDSFDLIWLDFFGNTTTSKNLLVVGSAVRSLNKGGILVITSLDRRHRTIKNQRFLQLMSCTMDCIESKLIYKNKTSPMRVFIFMKT